MGMSVDPNTVALLMKAGAEIAKAADASKRNALLIDFQQITVETFSKLTELQLANSALKERNSELEKECVRLKDWAAEKVGYSAREIAPGVFAEVRNDVSGSLEAAHKLCSNCFSKSVKSPLQQETGKGDFGRQIILRCPNGCPPLKFHNYKGG